MALTLITPPETPPVTLADAKAHLNIDHADDDALIELYLAAATGHIDGKYGILQRSFKPQTWELTYDEFPSDAIELPLPPLISVDSITYVDEDGATQTVDSANYVVDTKGVPGWVAPISTYDWPATMTVMNAITVRFTAGYADGSPESGESEGETPSNVPAPIRAAILMIVADWYEHRETVVTGTISQDIQMAAPVKALLAPYRVYTLA